MRVDLLPTTPDGRLIHVIEEASEVIQAVTKFLQYGPIATDPKTGIHYDNVQDLLAECHDVEHAINAVRADYTKHTATTTPDSLVMSATMDDPTIIRFIILNATNVIRAILALQTAGDGWLSVPGNGVFNSNTIKAETTNIDAMLHAYTGFIFAIDVFRTRCLVLGIADTSRHAVAVE